MSDRLQGGVQGSKTSGGWAFGGFSFPNAGAEKNFSGAGVGQNPAYQRTDTASDRVRISRSQET